MASKQEAEANSEELATFLASDESLAKNGHSESAANLSQATTHVIMRSLVALQEGLTALSEVAGHDLPATIDTNIGRCKQVLKSVNLIAYKQEKRDAGDFDTSQELICELYDFTAVDCTENKFKLSEAKNLP